MMPILQALVAFVGSLVRSRLCLQVEIAVAPQTWTGIGTR
jgi:hypothetical protein